MFFDSQNYSYYSDQPMAAFRINGDSTAPVPLPAAGWLMLYGLGGLGFLRRRKDA